VSAGPTILCRFFVTSRFRNAGWNLIMWQSRYTRHISPSGSTLSPSTSRWQARHPAQHLSRATTLPYRNGRVAMPAPSSAPANQWSTRSSATWPVTPRGPLQSTKPFREATYRCQWRMPDS
jgi:hypothetical protein